MDRCMDRHRNSASTADQCPTYASIVKIGVPNLQTCFTPEMLYSIKAICNNVR